MAAMDPFSSIVDNVTCPTYPAVPTFKRKGVISGTTSTNANGYAFLACTPNLSSTYDQIYVSDSSYVGDYGIGNQQPYDWVDCRSPIGQGSNVGIGVNSYSSSAFPGYTELIDDTDQQAASYAGRIVAVGLRVRYIGTEDNLGGLIYAKIHPNHATIQLDTVEDWADSASTVCVPVSRQWTMISSIGVKREEFEFPVWNNDFDDDSDKHIINNVFPWSGHKRVSGQVLDTDDGAPVMGIQISGTVAKSQFQYEYIIHNEYIGEKTVGIKTSNATEPLALPRITSVTNQKNVTRDDDRTPAKPLMKAAQATGDQEIIDIIGQCYGNFTEGVYEGDASSGNQTLGRRVFGYFFGPNKSGRDNTKFF